MTKKNFDSLLTVLCFGAAARKRTSMTCAASKRPRRPCGNGAGSARGSPENEDKHDLQFHSTHQHLPGSPAFWHRDSDGSRRFRNLPLRLGYRRQLPGQLAKENWHGPFVGWWLMLWMLPVLTLPFWLLLHRWSFTRRVREGARP